MLLLLVLLIAAILAGIVLTVAFMLLFGLWYAGEMEFGLPWLKWLTLNEAAEASGYSKFVCRLAIPMMSVKYEAEPLPEASDETKSDFQRYGLAPWNISKCRFRITGGTRRKRKEIVKQVSSGLRPAWI